MAPAGHTSYRILVDVIENRLGMSTHPPLIEGANLPMENAKTPRSSVAVKFLVETSRRFSKANRLTVLMIGAGTDIASAILTDPTIVERVSIIQMGFNDEQGGNEFNVANDVRAVQAILDSNVPLVLSRVGKKDLIESLSVDKTASPRIYRMRCPGCTWSLQVAEVDRAAGIQRVLRIVHCLRQTVSEHEIRAQLRLVREDSLTSAASS